MIVRALCTSVLALVTARASAQTAPAELDERTRNIVATLTRHALLPPDPTNAVADDPRAAVLGQFLFFDARLSPDGKFACATCHDPARAFTDGEPLGRGRVTLARNVPTLLDALASGDRVLAENYLQHADHCYRMMVEDSVVDTFLTEYREKPENSADLDIDNWPLKAVALCDRLSDGISMVYSFYDPSEPALSLGTYMIMEHVAFARRLGLPYLYLGYWIEGSEKMAYKARFTPQERLGAEQWERFDKPGGIPPKDPG